MISGTWDFAGVLVALSGFLLVGGTALVFAFHSTAREFWLHGDTLADLRRSHAQSGTLTFVIWGSYFVVVVGGALYVLRDRAKYTVLYNLAPDELEEILSAVFARLGVPHSRRGDRLYVGYGPPEKEGTRLSTAIGANFDPAAPAIDPQRKAVVDLDGSTMMRYASMNWNFAAPEVRRELEAELARDLERFEIESGRAAGWFLTAAGSLMIGELFLLATFLLVELRRH